MFAAKRGLQQTHDGVVRGLPHDRTYWLTVTANRYGNKANTRKRARSGPTTVAFGANIVIPPHGLSFVSKPVAQPDISELTTIFWRGANDSFAADKLLDNGGLGRFLMRILLTV